MDGLYQDIIIIMTIFAFSFWIIKKHYDNAWDIENLQIELKKAREISDLSVMQRDLIEFRQSLINIDVKYKLKDRWAVNKIEEISDILLPHLALSVKNLEEVVKSQGIANLSLQDAVNMTKLPEEKSDE